MKTELLTRDPELTANSLPVPVVPGDYRGPSRHRRPVEYGHRRRDGMLRKAANFVLRRNTRSTPAEPVVPQQPVIPTKRTHATLYASGQLPNRQPLPQEERQPIAPRLRYGQGELETLKPDKPGEDNVKTGGTSVPANRHQPLLSAEQVHEQLGPGIEIGALQAVIHLPGAEEPLYVFDQTTYSQNGPDPRFVFATPTQLGKIRTHIEIGQPSREEINGEILTLHRTNSSPELVSATIGSERWLPGRPYGDRSEAPIPDQYQEVDGRQMRVSFDIPGTLYLRDYDPVHPTVVEVNPAMIPAQDPWPNGPNYNGPSVI